jgi:transcriptional regulator with XRE-family HTH domain
VKSGHLGIVELNDREAAICRRFREARLRIKWKMPDFARELEIPRDRLASYEYARSPIRYQLAKRMCDRFNINQRWLATGRLPSRHYVDVHDYTESQIPDKMLFSEAFDAFLSKPLDNQIAQIAKTLHCKEEEIENNWQRIGMSWPVGSPGAKLSELYHERLLQLRLHQQPEGIQKNIYRQLNAVLDQLLPGGSVSQQASIMDKGKEKGLTYSAIYPNNLPNVKEQWPALKRKLQKATTETGTKSKLAKFLKVDLTRVSQWLTDAKSAREPGAEYALRMLYWVEHPELQK